MTETTTLVADENTKENATTAQEQPAPTSVDTAQAGQTAQPAEAVTETAPTEDGTKSTLAAEAAETETKTEEKAEPKAPETYEFSVPEGMQEGFELGEPITEAMSEVFRELDLSQEEGAKVVDSVLPAWQRYADELDAKANLQFQEAQATDKRIGGEKLDEHIAQAKEVATKLYPGLQPLLDSPWGSSPDLIHLLAAQHRAVSEDSLVGGNVSGQHRDLRDPQQRQQVMYRDYPSS